ncbi:glucose-6-phosphate dehydrogenase [Epibacterium sp. SM1979]|uniref:Glucose-6-phosphate 1-dehydrogenase n=1 Tax=Tritonibacter litoralis TaxID=2662264 RepID=A0A843YGE7_9RHOB|nr:glucose-6-phosphate dehydrogenase [Tritonibacter litoralis]MQQ10216.1 glucose-6-phosphate dehydrogenase [Tritonibacter litoralis]
MVSRVIPVDSFDLVLFGATGDLARRKILPSLFHRFIIGQFDHNSRVIGASRSEMDRAAFCDLVAKALNEFAHPEDTSADNIKAFLDILDYVAIDAKSENGWTELGEHLRDDVVRAFYLSVAPGLFADIAGRLKTTGIATDDSRVVVEKPFGNDLATAKALNAALSAHFEEHQIYRIDHYLGKETVQNLMALRFANSLFEPLWNSSQIDHVQITVAESIDVAGRGEYYDKSGAMRDMVQNHLMQLLCLTAMEPPARFTPNAVRNEKLKVIEALNPVTQDDIARGQYRAREGGDSYHDHAGDPDSTTESFVAMKVEVANWRWAGTPFYLRTGKCLRQRSSEIAVFFRDPPHNIFEAGHPVAGNVLVIRLQPDEGITLHTTIKDPGPGGMRLTTAKLDMTFADSLPEAGRPQDAYERLIMDVIRGNQTLFMRGDEVEAAWAWADPIIDGFADNGKAPQLYDQGGSGPDDSLLLMHRDERRWREIGR